MYVNYLENVPKGNIEFWAIKVFDRDFYCDIIQERTEIYFFPYL